MTRYNFAFAALILMLTTSPSWAVPIPTGPLSIEFLGLDLSYANDIVSDGKSPNGHNGDPNEADPLDVVTFTVGLNPQDTLTSNVYADVSIPGVANLMNAVPPNIVITNTTSGPGYFDLLIGTSPSAAEYLKLEFNSVSIVYMDSAGFAQFLFGGTVAGVSGQNLPFNIIAGTPVAVSFSASIVPGTKVAEGGFVESFDASGSGEINGEAVVPEPAVCILASLGLVATLLTRARD